MTELLTIPVALLKPGDHIPRHGWIREVKLNRKKTHVIVYYYSNKATALPVNSLISIVRSSHVDQP